MASLRLLLGLTSVLRLLAARGADGAGVADTETRRTSEQLKLTATVGGDCCGQIKISLALSNAALFYIMQITNRGVNQNSQNTIFEKVPMSILHSKFYQEV